MMGDAEYTADFSIALDVFTAFEKPSALMEAAVFARFLFAAFAAFEAATKKFTPTALDVPLFQDTSVHPPPSVTMSQ